MEDVDEKFEKWLKSLDSYKNIQEVLKQDKNNLLPINIKNLNSNEHYTLEPKRSLKMKIIYGMLIGFSLMGVAHLGRNEIQSIHQDNIAEQATIDGLPHPYKALLALSYKMFPPEFIEEFSDQGRKDFFIQYINAHPDDFYKERKLDSDELAAVLQKFSDSRNQKEVSICLSRYLDLTLNK